MGHLHLVTTETELEASVQKLADRLSEKSSLVLARMKSVANQSMDQAQEAALRYDLLSLRDSLRSHDMHEGLAALWEKRKPKFKGR